MRWIMWQHVSLFFLVLRDLETFERLRLCACAPVQPPHPEPHVPAISSNNMLASHSEIGSIGSKSRPCFRDTSNCSGR